MTEPKGLTDFLDHSGARYRVFDLGSQLRELSSGSWQAFDRGEPYAYPHLGHAWIVLLLWNPDNREQHSIWFMKLPLDEQACLPVAVHQDVLQRLYQALGTEDPGERQRLLTDHPYQFTPAPAKMAALHARASRILGVAPSQHYEPARRYLLEDGPVDTWQQLGVQGIAEVLERLDERAARQLAKRLPQLPREPRLVVLEALEHQRPAPSLVQALITQAEQADDAELDTATLRAVSQTDAKGMVSRFAEKALQRHPDHLNLVLALLSRHPDLLENTELSLTALERLAELADQDGFNRVIEGLALQPGLSGLVLKTLRHPKRSDNLARAIAGLIDRTRSVQ